MANKNDFITPTPHETDIPTTQFDLSHDNHLSMKLGQAYPCLLYDAPAHSTIKVRPSFGLDFMPFRTPIQSSIRAHLKFYKIPKRILMKRFKEWRTLDNNIVLPYIKRSDYWHATGSLADYMGIPSTVITNTDFYNRVLSGFGGVRVPLVGDIGQHYDGIYSFASYNGLVSLSPAPDYGNGSCRIYPLFERLSTDRTKGHQLYVYSQSSITWATTHKFTIYIAEFSQDGFHVVKTISDITYSTGTALADTKFYIPSTHKNESVVVNGTSCYCSQLNFRFAEKDNNEINDLISNRGVPLFAIVAWSSANEAVFGNASSTIIPHGNQLVKGALITADTEGKLSITNTLRKYGVDCVMNWWANKDIMREGSATPFMSVNNADPAIPISALPFRAYEFIHNYFYRNLDIDPFLKSGIVPFDEFITNDGTGADTTTPLEFFQVPYEYDMFTTCVKSPTFGDSPLVPLRGHDDNGDNIAEIHMHDDLNGDYIIGLSYNSTTGAITGVRSDETYTEKDSVALLKEAINYGISIEDFRNYSALQRFQDRMMRVNHGHGSKYKNFVKEFFGTSPNLGEDFPEYLGGVSQSINVSKLMNTGEQANLGEFCGVGQIRSDGETISCFCNEDCYIMGIIYLSVTPVYTQQLPRLFTKSKMMEFANPQFNNITPQPIYKNQIAPLQLTSGHYNDVFGYNVPFAEYRQMLDECHGNFRTNSMHDYLMQRLFASAPSLNAAFIYQKNEDVVDVFKSTIDDDKVFGIIHFDMRDCKLPFPQYMTSKIV